MLLYEFSDLHTMPMQIHAAPDNVDWVTMDWKIGDQICMFPEQSAIPILAQDIGLANTLPVITDKDDPDLAALFDSSHIQNSYSLVIEGRIEHARYADERLGLRGVAYPLERFEFRTGGRAVTKPRLLDGFTVLTAETPAKHGCVTVQDMDKYDYSGIYHRLSLDELLVVPIGTNNTWVFVMDGLIEIDDAPCIEGNYVEVLEPQFMTCLEDDTIVFILQKNDPHPTQAS